MAQYDYSSPSTPSTIAEVLLTRAVDQSNDVAYCIGDRIAGNQYLSYSQLDDVARRVAGSLAAAHSQDTPVLLYCATPTDFVCALFGCLYARTIAVPLYPLDSARRTQTLARLVDVVRDSGAQVGLASSRLLEELRRATEAHAVLGRVQWLNLTEAMQGPEGTDKGRAHDPSGAAILQYTSGSTRRPRGVVLSHRNIVSNLKMMQHRQQYCRTHTFVSWLPLAHDWGLIGSVLLPMWCGSRAVLMTPQSFIARPVSWLETISQHSYVASGGPSFAYDYCVRRISAEDKKQLNLSSWCRAGVGAGRVSEDVLERFVEAFEPAGFRRETFYNGYGLAEATLSVSATSPSEAPTVLQVNRAALEVHHVRVSATGEGASVRLVGSGEPNEGVSVCIVDPSTGWRCPGDRVGEVWVSGPNVAGGYWRGPAETAAVFVVDGDVVYLRTGDLGFVHGSQLFITGRLKDMMIVRGRNVYPEDVEWAVAKCHDGVRRGGTVAFELAGRLVVVQEIHDEWEVGERTNIVGAIRRAVVDASGIYINTVALIAAREAPKTSSGKVRRSACREAYVSGRLHVLFESEMDGGDGDGARRQDVVRSTEVEVLNVWRTVLDRDTVGVDDNFVESGGDSLRAYECQARVAEAFGVEVGLEWFMSDDATVRGLVKMLSKSR